LKTLYRKKKREEKSYKEGDVERMLRKKNYFYSKTLLFPSNFI